MLTPLRVDSSSMHHAQLPHGVLCCAERMSLHLLQGLQRPPLLHAAAHGCAAGLLQLRELTRTAQTREGYIMTRTLPPSEMGGRLLKNFARTTPMLPWGRVTRPQMAR